MTTYLEILANQHPFPIMIDDNNRTIFSVNFRTKTVHPTNNFEHEIAKLLDDENVGSLYHPTTNPTGDIFIGPSAIIPTGDGPYISVIRTGGLQPIETHDNKKYDRPFVQILVRALDYNTGKSKIDEVYNKLDGKRSITISA